MKQKDTRGFAIYSRKSRFTGKGESIENQIELCRQRLRSMEVPERQIVVFEDEGFSGGNTQRPQFQAMMREVRAGNLQGVICYRLDRISRNVLDFAEMQKEFGEHGVDFISLRDNFDTTTPTGRAMMLMSSVFAQLERETIAERIRDNMYELAKSGRWLGGHTPTGYKSVQVTGSVTVDGKARKAYRLETIPEEAELVRLIYRKFLETYSLTKVDAYLLEQGIKTKTGRDFTRFSIGNILRNPVYLVADEAAWEYFEKNQVEVYADRADFDGNHGVMAYNKTVQKPGKTNQTRAMEDWIVSVGRHQGLISSADWVRVQEILDRNKSKSYRKPKSNVALLSGLLFCGSCGSYMRPKLTQRQNAAGEYIYTYLCEKKERSHGAVCSQKNLNGNELDKAVCRQICALTEDTSEFQRQMKKVKAALETSNTGHRSHLDALFKESRENEAKIKNLVASLETAAGAASAEYITGQINDLHEKQQKLEHQIAELESLTTAYSDADFAVLREALERFSAAFETMSVEQKRAALRLFVRKIVWDGENIHVYLFGDSEAEIDSEDLLQALSEGAGADPEGNSMPNARTASGGSPQPLGGDSK